MVGMADGYAQASGGPAQVNLHTAPGVGNAMGAIFNAQANHSPLVVTAGQQVALADDAAGEPHQPRRDPDAAPAGQVELRAAARRGRAARARARHPPGDAAAARARPSSRSRWTTGTPRSTTATSRAAIDAPDHRARRRRPRGGRRARRAARGRREPGAGRRPRHRRQRRLGRRRRARRAPAPARSGRSPRRAAGGSASPRATRTSRASLPPAIGPVVRDARRPRPDPRRRRLGLPLLPEHPGRRCCPRAPTLVAITSDPDEAARAPMGDAIVADVKLTLERLLDAGRRVRARRRRVAARADRRARTQDPITGTAAMHALRGALPRGRDRRARGAVVDPVAAQPAAALEARAATTSAPAAGSASASSAAVGVQLAQPDRPVVCVVGEGSAQYAITAFWSAVAYDVPVTFLVLRNSEYAILKWFAAIEGVEGAPGLDLPALDSAAVAAGYGVTRRAGRRRRRAARGARRRDRVATARAGRGRGRARHVAGLGAGSRWRCSSRRSPHRARRRAPPAPTARPTGSPAGPPSRCARELVALLGADRVLARASDLVRYASDASPYRLIPEGGRHGPRRRRRRQGARLRARARRPRSPSAPAARASTARPRPTGSSSTSAATSAGSRSSDGGARVRVEPGTVLGHVNRVLAPHGHKLGPDPASTDIATRRRRDRQQLRRDALRRRPRLLLDRAPS